jgi:hypothetical protein
MNIFGSPPANHSRKQLLHAPKKNLLQSRTIQTVPRDSVIKIQPTKSNQSNVITMVVRKGVTLPTNFPKNPIDAMDSFISKESELMNEHQEVQRNLQQSIVEYNDKITQQIDDLQKIITGQKKSIGLIVSEIKSTQLSIANAKKSEDDTLIQTKNNLSQILSDKQNELKLLEQSLKTENVEFEREKKEYDTLLENNSALLVESSNKNVTEQNFKKEMNSKFVVLNQNSVKLATEMKLHTKTTVIKTLLRK